MMASASLTREYAVGRSTPVETLVGRMEAACVWSLDLTSRLAVSKCSAPHRTNPRLLSIILEKRTRGTHSTFSWVPIDLDRRASDVNR